MLLFTSTFITLTSVVLIGHIGLIMFIKHLKTNHKEAKHFRTKELVGQSYETFNTIFFWWWWDSAFVVGSICIHRFYESLEEYLFCYCH